MGVHQVGQNNQNTEKRPILGCARTEIPGVGLLRQMVPNYITLRHHAVCS